jgi:hypothetical protein
VRIRSVLSHSAQAVAEGALIALLVVGLMVGTAFAAKGGHGGGASGATGGYSVTVTPGGPYTFGEEISVTTNAPVYPNNTGPWIELKCYQGTVLVMSDSHAGFSAGWYYNWPFYLGPTQYWASGAADCTVRVWHQANNRQVTDAKTSFHVDG